MADMCLQSLYIGREMIVFFKCYGKVTLWFMQYRECKMLPALDAFLRKWLLIDTKLVEVFKEMWNDVKIAFVYKP